MVELKKGQKIALVFNLHGEVAKQLVPLLAVAENYTQVILFHEELVVVDHPKLESRRFDPMNLPAYADDMKGHDLFCFYDIERPKQASKTDIKIRSTYTYQIAQLAAEHQVNQFCLLSTAGASKDALSLKNKIRAYLIESILQLPFWATHIFCPSTVVNSRTTNPSTFLRAQLNKQLDSLKSADKISTEAHLIARTMLHAAQQIQQGAFAYQPAYFQDFKATILGQ